MNKNIIKPILITGSSGFIGSNLLRYFILNKIKVNIILRKKSNLWRIKDLISSKYVKIHIGDLSNNIRLKKIIDVIKPKTIFHLATYGAYSFQNDEVLLKKNIYESSINLLRYCSNYKFNSFINTGTNSEYGFKTKKMSESDILDPNSLYAVHKSAVTQYFRYISISKKLPITTVRPFHVYGPYEDIKRLIPNLLLNLIEGKMIKLVSPKISRDMIYIDDCIDLYIKIAINNNDYGSVYNMGSGKSYTIKRIVEMAQRHTKTNLILKPKWNSMGNRSWDQEIWQSNMSYVQEKLKWKNKISLDAGIKKTYLWLKQNKKLYK